MGARSVNERRVRPDYGTVQAPPAGGKPTASSFGPTGALTATGDTGTVYLTAGTYRDLDFGGANVTTSEPGVTIVNCKAGAFVSYYGNYWLESTESFGIYVDCYYNAIDTVMLKNNRVHGTDGDGMDLFSTAGHVLSNVTVDGYYAAGFDYTSDPTSHGDGIQVRGVNGLVIRNATIDMGPWQVLGGYTPKNAAIYIEDVNSISNVLIEDVWLNGGGYTFYTAAGTTNCVADRMHVDGSDFGYAPINVVGGRPGGWSITNSTGPDGNPL